jgi:hypothetical protein
MALPLGRHRITKPYFRTCSPCLARSQAPFCLYTLRAISSRAEGTFGRLRYSLGGDRPSQTACLTMSRHLSCPVRIPIHQGWYPNGGSTITEVTASMPPTYPVRAISEPNVRLQ